MKKILVVNAGSSSIKWAIFNKETLKEEFNGLAERIGVTGFLKMGKISKEIALPDHESAVKEIIQIWNENKIISSPEEIESIGFRIVHGGTFFEKATVINENVIEKIAECSIYAPLHNPAAVATIKAVKKFFPSAKLSAHFDTAFHTTIPKINAIYPIDKDLTNDLKIKKYGAHGLSHNFIANSINKILKKDKSNIINFHLGNGSSLCAIKDSKSFDTSMGLTPLAGIMMGTRSGNIDPSIHNFVCKQKNISIEEFTDILNKKSGLYGVSGISNDFRDVSDAAKNGNKDAEFAIDLFAQKAADISAIYANKLKNQLDAIVFTAGIGENASLMREKIVEKLHYGKFVLDKELNNTSPKNIGTHLLISSKNSEIPIYVIRTNEELLIAQEIKTL